MKQAYCISLIVCIIGILIHSWILLAISTGLNALLGILANVD